MPHLKLDQSLVDQAYLALTFYLAIDEKLAFS